MADEGEFQLVSRKKQRKRGKNKKSKIEETVKDASSENTLEDCNIDRIITQIETFRDEIEASDFFSSLKDLLMPAKSEEMKDNTSESFEKESSKDKEKLNPLSPYFDDIICYGVGCIRTCPNAKYQFALLLLLKMFLMIPNEQCCLYEPLFNEHDKKIVNHFGCTIIDHNEEAKRAVTRPTLFFMPHCSKLLYNNVLWANWGPALKNVVIFGNGFSSYQQRLPSRQLISEVMYIAKVSFDMMYVTIVIILLKMGKYLGTQMAFHSEPESKTRKKRTPPRITLLLEWESHLSVIYISRAYLPFTFTDIMHGKDIKENLNYCSKILPYLQEVIIPNTFYLKDIFNDSSIHFFREHVLSKIAKDFWNPRPEPMYDVNDPEIVTKQR